MVDEGGPLEAGLSFEEGQEAFRIHASPEDGVHLKDGGTGVGPDEVDKIGVHAVSEDGDVDSFAAVIVLFRGLEADGAGKVDVAADEVTLADVASEGGFRDGNPRVGLLDVIERLAIDDALAYPVVELGQGMGRDQGMAPRLGEVIAASRLSLVSVVKDDLAAAADAVRAPVAGEWERAEDGTWERLRMLEELLLTFVDQGVPLDFPVDTRRIAPDDAGDGLA